MPFATTADLSSCLPRGAGQPTTFSESEAESEPPLVEVTCAVLLYWAHEERPVPLTMWTKE